MGDRQQPVPYLNGGYYGYGPPIPPPTPKPKRRFKPPGGCCCLSCIGSCIGSCLKCCGCCILSLIWNVLIAVAVILAVTALILWLVFRPNAVKFYVADANLNRFNLDSNDSNLHYDLDLNFTIRNPNQRLGVFYDAMQVSGYYGDQRFGSVDIAPFYQEEKNTAVVAAKMEGQNLVVLGDGARADLKEDDVAGVYRISVRLAMSVRFKFWVVKSWKVKPKIRCDDLKVPLGSSNSTSGFKFQTVQCDFDFR